MSFHHKAPKQQGEDKRDFDTTSCREKQYGRWVHRDYLAHCFRWGFARRYIKGGERVLDVGCGPDQALAGILTYTASGIPEKLIAVDYGKVKPALNAKWFELRAEFDFTTRWKELEKEGPFDVITCLEVIEHMQKTHGAKLLKGMHALLKPDTGRLILSTPVFDPKVGMAMRHVHEYLTDELANAITKAGFIIEQRFGTFQNALKIKQTNPEHRAVWEALKTYYSDDVLACFLAPLYPDLSRNNLWLLRKGSGLGKK